MDRISVRALAASVRLIREPIVVTYSYPRNHPLHGAGEDCGVFVPMKEWEVIERITGYATPSTEGGIRIPEEPAQVTKFGDIVDD